LNLRRDFELGLFNTVGSVKNMAFMEMDRKHFAL
jgi:hypothetical protein